MLNTKIFLKMIPNLEYGTTKLVFFFPLVCLKIVHNPKTFFIHVLATLNIEIDISQFKD